MSGIRRCSGLQSLFASSAALVCCFIDPVMTVST
jgi:hypothetical protein